MINIQVFWDTTPSRWLNICRRFEETCYISPQSLSSRIYVYLCTLF